MYLRDEMQCERRWERSGAARAGEAGAHAAAVVGLLELDRVLDDERLALDRLDDLREHGRDRCGSAEGHVRQARAQRGSGGCVRTVALRLVLDLEPEVPGLDRVVAPGQAPLACAKAPVRPARKRKRAGSPQAKRRLAPGKSELLDTDQTFSKAASSSKFSKNSTSPSGCGRAVCV